MNNKGGVRNNDYNYNYKQYLKNKCKSFYDIQRAKKQTDGTYKSQCCDDNKNCVTLKLKNKNYHTNGAVSSSSRLARLKYNTIVKKDGNCKNGEGCSKYTPQIKYKDINLNPEENVVRKEGCNRRRIAGVIRKCYR